MSARIGLLGSHRDTRVNHWSGLSLVSCVLSEWGHGVKMGNQRVLTLVVAMGIVALSRTQHHRLLSS